MFHKNQIKPTVESMEDRLLMAASLTADPGVAVVSETTSASQFTFDIDGDGQMRAETDGLLVLRHLFGFTGQALTENAVNPAGTRTDAASISAYLESHREFLDVDGDGTAGALTDGCLILRALESGAGAALMQDYQGAAASSEPLGQVDSTRDTVETTLSNPTGQGSFTALPLTADTSNLTATPENAASTQSLTSPTLTPPAGKVQAIQATPTVSGNEMSIVVSYTSRTASPTTGLGLKLYYDGTQLTNARLSNVLATDKVGQQIDSDTRNGDRDTRTNMLANVAWADIHGNWPGTSLPVQLYTITFTVQPEFHGDLSIHFTGFTAAGYTLFAPPLTITIA